MYYPLFLNEISKIKKKHYLEGELQMNTLFKQFQRYTFLQVILYIVTGSLALLYPQQFSKWVVYLIAAYVAF